MAWETCAHTHIAMKMDGFCISQDSCPESGVWGFFLFVFCRAFECVCVYVFLTWVVFFFFFSFFLLRAIKICKLLILYYTKLGVTFVHDLAARNLVLLFCGLPNKQTKGTQRSTIHSRTWARLSKAASSLGVCSLPPQDSCSGLLLTKTSFP